MNYVAAFIPQFLAASIGYAIFFGVTGETMLGAFAAMIAAVPGATISAPVSFILIGVGGVALGTSAIAPIGIAVITAYLAISTVKFFKAEQDAM